MSSKNSQEEAVENGTILFALPFIIVIGAVWLVAQLLLWIGRILLFKAALNVIDEDKDFVPDIDPDEGAGLSFYELNPHLDPDSPLYEGNPNSPYFNPNTYAVDQMLNN